MYPYPPWHFDVGWWLCAVIWPVAFIVLAAAISRRSTSARRVTYPVIAVVLVWIFVVAVLSPQMGQARPTAQKTQCGHNLRTIAAAMHSYHDEHGHFPSPQLLIDGTPPTSWRVDLIPYFSEQGSGESLAGDYKREFAWDAAANLPVAQRQPQIYWCPTNQTPQDQQQRWYTAYAFLTGSGTAFPSNGPAKIDDFADGTEYTLLAVEACGRNIVWTEPRDVNVSRDNVGINTPGDRPETSDGTMSSYHRITSDDPGGANCAFADGRVMFFNKNIDPDVLRKLMTPAGGEAISAGDF
jgi:prepilin-type processing-associated H-X9-DG protein